MRIAVVSDIHGNWTAFESVLADLRQTAPDVTVRPARADAASASGFTGGDTRTVPAAVVATVARCPGWHGPTAS